MTLDAQLCQAASDAYKATPTFTVAGDVEVVLSEIDGVTVIAFPGTDPRSLEDWERDVSAWPVDVPNHPKLGLCHSGFATGAEAALPLILAALTPGKPVAVTGHSLGGALAIDTCALLVDMGLIPVRTSTFGAPRVSLDDKLGNLISGIPGLRFRNGQDPVPTVPLWPYRTDRVWTNVGVIRHSGSVIDDHFIQSYLKVVT